MHPKNKEHRKFESSEKIILLTLKHGDQPRTKTSLFNQTTKNKIDDSVHLLNRKINVDITYLS